IKQYIVEIVRTSREHMDVQLGGSPRASLALFRTSQALAALRGHEFVLPDDVKRMCGPVLGHRLILKPESRLRKITPQRVVDEILASVRVPLIATQAERA